MQEILTPPVPPTESDLRAASTSEAMKKAGTDAQKLGRDVKDSLGDFASRGRGVVDDVAGAAKEDLAGRGREVAGRAREYLREGRERASKIGGRVSEYADENTTLVAGVAFGLGLLLGFLITRRR